MREELALRLRDFALAQRANDIDEETLRVVIDANRAQVVSVEAVGGPPAMYRGPYASTGGPYWRRPYGPYGA